MTGSAPPHIPLAADERETLLSFLDFYRAALLDRTDGLDAPALNATHPPTTLTLARLVSHMAWVEYFWFRVRLAGEDMPAPFADLDWEADDDAEMTYGASLTVAELRAVFEAAVADSKARVEAADGFDDLTVGTNQDGEHWNLRWILVHMIEEYARHCGHADLIRESIDGDVVG